MIAEITTMCSAASIADAIVRSQAESSRLEMVVSASRDDVTFKNLLAQTEIDTHKERMAQASRVDIRPVSFTDILDAPNASDLFRAYAAACIVPDAEPQRFLYEAMDKAGVIHCFGAYVETDKTSLLVGFAAVICGIMPHDGHLVATLESLFVLQDYRSTGAADMLQSTIENFAIARGCRCLIRSARIGSAYDKILSRRPGCNPTHTQYTMWLNGYKGGR